MNRFVLVLCVLTACGPKLAPSEETRAIELEIDDLLSSHRTLRREEWRAVELDESRTAFIDVEIPREGCNLLVVLTDGEGEMLELRREPTVSLGAPGLSWFSVCADEPGARSLATTVIARAPMSRALHLAIYSAPGREGEHAMNTSYLPEPPPAFVMAPRVAPTITPAPEVAPLPADPGAAATSDCGANPRETAREAYATGRDAAERGELEAASTAFDRAYECVPDGTILFNSAAVYARRGDADAAIERYERVLSAHGEGLSRVLRRQVDDALQALRRPVRIVVEAPSGYVVTVGGVVLERGEGRVIPGTYEVAWRRRDTEARTVTQVVVRPGERANVSFPEARR
jgi:hypothetical protein